MPHEATIEDIENVYMEGWRLGLKAIAIYRDGSKRQQALTTSKEKDAKKQNTKVSGVGSQVLGEGSSDLTPNTQNLKPLAQDEYKPRRRHLPDERRAITHKFAVGNHEGYITVGLYDDGTPGEIFVTMAKEGSVISGLMDSFSAAISVGLQYGVPLQVLVNKFVHMRFEPSGYTTNPNIRIAKSIVDYIFRWMAMKFLPVEQQRAVGINVVEEPESLESIGKPAADAISAPAGTPQPNLFAAAPAPTSAKAAHTATFDNQSDAPACDSCGSIMVRNAACYKCLNCGSTSGCS
jgi:ribonucleoside-diphosphate reductase alpha chain